jgi:hypothetical protein
MTNSIQRDPQGPDWPLGFVGIVTPGTPVGFMSVVDPTSDNAPESPTSPTNYAYTVRAEEIMVQAFKPASAGTQLNIGNIYIVRRGNGGGTGNRSDTGSIVATLVPGQTLFFTAAAVNRNVWSPYRYSIDADFAGDGAFITLIVQ